MVDAPVRVSVCDPAASEVGTTTVATTLPTPSVTTVPRSTGVECTVMVTDSAASKPVPVTVIFSPAASVAPWPASCRAASWPRASAAGGARRRLRHLQVHPADVDVVYAAVLVGTNFAVSVWSATESAEVVNVAARRRRSPWRAPWCRPGTGPCRRPRRRHGRLELDRVAVHDRRGRRDVEHRRRRDGGSRLTTKCAWLEVDPLNAVRRSARRSRPASASRRPAW